MNKDVDKAVKDKTIPFSDVKNILDEIHFEDEVTRSQCRGWLVLPSRRYLQADILFPGCDFDCRITLRKRSGEYYVSVYSFIRSFVRSFVRSLIRSFVRSFVQFVQFETVLY